MLSIYMGMRGDKLMKRSFLMDTSHKVTVPLPLQTMTAENHRRVKKQKTRSTNRAVMKEEYHSEVGKRKQVRVLK